jgi:ABC-2 type transport system ATP-binding protein
MKTPVAAFSRVVKRYPGAWPARRPTWALDDVSFDVRSGEIFGLLGPNRAGKTTLVKLLLSLCHATSGKVERLGRPVEDRATLGAVGYVHESQAFPRYLSAAGLLEFYAALNRETGARVRRRLAELLERFGLADRSREPIASFSKGMLQRLALAQALVNEPRLLVLDEPSEGMDLLARALLHDTLAEQRRLGRAVILVSHSLSDAQRLCDRVAVVRAGRLAYLGTLEALEVSGQGGSLEAALKTLYTTDGDQAISAASLPHDAAENAWSKVDAATRGLELLEAQP